jgi:hypothetical protein
LAVELLTAEETRIIARGEACRGRASQSAIRLPGVLMASTSLVLADFFEVGSFAFVLVLGIAALGLAMAFGSAQAKRANDAWTQVGNRLGLRPRAGSFWKAPRLSGSMYDFPVEVDVYTEGHGKSRHTYTRVKVRFPSLRLGLSLRRQGFLRSISKMFGLQQDIELGEAGFDAEVIVEGSDPHKLRQFLNAGRRMRIRRFFNNYPRAVIADDLVTCTVSGMLRTADQLQQMITSAVGIAWHISGERQADENLTHALEAQEVGHGEEALRLVQSATNERRPGDPVVAELVEEQPIQAELMEEQLIEGELLTLAGRRDEAQRVFQQARQSAPYDEEIAEWAEQPTTGPKCDVAEAVASHAEDVPDPPERKVDVADLCQELFQEGGTSYQINHHFEKHYTGAAIGWTGTLKRVESFTYDFVFGNRPGTRAVIVVHELDHAVYGDRTVSAIVRLDPDAEEPLRGKQGQPIAFTGKLHKVDSLLRNIFVVEGTLRPADTDTGA